MRFGMILMIASALLSAPMYAAAADDAIWAPSASIIGQEGRTDDPTVLDDILVDGRRLERTAVDAFVRAAVAPVGERSLAVWRDPLCVGVMNMEGEAARFMADRVADWAHSLDVTIARPGCRPNVLVVLTSDGDATASDLIQARRGDFQPGIGADGVERGTAALRRFRTSGQVARWWHVSFPIDRTGEIIGRMPGEMPFEGGDELLLRRPSGFGAQATGGTGASRFRREARDKLGRVVIVLESRAFETADLLQISDFVSMIALSQVAPETAMGGADSILNLFTPGASIPPSMTRWDQALLKAIYGAEQNRTTAWENVRVVAAAMMREMAAPQPAAD